MSVMLGGGLLLLAAGCEKTPQKPETSTTGKVQRVEYKINVMSFNVAVDNQQEGKGWQWRKDAVNKMIGEEQPEIIGFQEAQAHEITDMITAHPEYDWYGLGRDSGRTPPRTTEYSSEESMAVFWLRDSLEALDYGTFWLSETPEVPGKGWDASYVRTCTWIRFRQRRTDQQLMMFNTHLDNSGATARAEGLKLILEKIASLNKDRLPVFLTADFNKVSTDKIFDPVKAVMQSTRDVAAQSERDKKTYNGYNAPKSQIDHIFFSGSGLTALKFRVLDGDYGAKWISDHYPVVGSYRYTRYVTKN